MCLENLLNHEIVTQWIEQEEWWQYVVRWAKGHEEAKGHKEEAENAGIDTIDSLSDEALLNDDDKLEEFLKDCWKTFTTKTEELVDTMCIMQTAVAARGLKIGGYDKIK